MILFAKAVGCSAVPRAGSASYLRARRRMVGALLIVLCAGPLGSVVAAADPQPVAPRPDPAPVTGDVMTVPTAAAAQGCGRFQDALRVASAHYNSFAYAIAGNGTHVDYRDPQVRSDNTDGRAALRAAAGEARAAAATAGLAPEIAAAMRDWSWQAIKLTLAMGLRGDGDTLNRTAGDLNRHAEAARMACARAGAGPARRR